MKAVARTVQFVLSDNEPVVKVAQTEQSAELEIEFRAELNHTRGYALHAAADAAKSRREPVQINRLRVRVEVVE